MKNIVIIGAGPAGLTAAYALHRQNAKYNILILEKDSQVGGLSKTFVFEGNRVDIGGHRYFSQNQLIIDMWNNILPIEEGKMRITERKSHILYDGNYIEYPVRFSLILFHALGIRKTFQILFGYLKASFSGREIKTLEDYYKKQFGDVLYELFFENYTEKLWGMSAKQLSADWGSQRVRRISLGFVISNALDKVRRKEERSLIRSFYYPTYGAGQMWDALSDQLQREGVTVKLESRVTSLEYDGNRINSVSYMKDGCVCQINPDIVISSMPLRELIVNIDPCPEAVKNIAEELQYRDMLLVAVCVKKTDAGALFQNYDKDCWIYLQDTKVKACRLQILNNWSEAMVADQDGYLLELEYFCDKQSDLWNGDSDTIIVQACSDLREAQVIDASAIIKHHFIRRIEDAYPIYTGAYYQLQQIRDWVDTVPNLMCIGRNGQHHYNNMDHSMETALAAVESIPGNEKSREKIWNANNSPQYHEKPYKV